jgi:ribosome maturation protein Sdo1
VLDGASKATLENEFETSNEDECIIKILESGEVQKTQVRNYPILHNLVLTKLTQQYIEQ